MFNNINLKPEERCGHYITSDVKQLWNVQLDLLEKLKFICKKHDIKYYAAGGTLLGAIRHQGYIPWDDDIDVHMLAADYEKFCEVVKKELTGEYCLQINNSMARIRNSNTTAITAGDIKKLRIDKNHNCGIFIDIFPLHNVYDNKFLRLMQKLVFHISERLAAGYEKTSCLRENQNKYWKYNFSKAVLLWRIFSLFYDYEEYLNLNKRALYLCKQSKHIGLVSFIGINEKFIWSADWFSKTCEMPFEDTTICCPKEYDLILKQQYGDYMVFRKGCAIHTMETFDAERPFREMLKGYFNSDSGDI